MTSYTIHIHEDGAAGYWAEVAELPGAFAAGETLTELHSGIAEAIVMCTEDDDAVQVEIEGLEPPAPGEVTVAHGHLLDA